MRKLVSFFAASLMILTARIASAGDFSATLTDGSTITVLQGAECGGSSAVFDIVLPASCSGAIDPDTGNISITSCNFAPAEQPGSIITLSAISGSGTYDGSNLTLTPDINVNIIDNPPTGISCDSETPTSIPLSGVVEGSGTITFSGSIPGPTYAVTDTCPLDIALMLNCSAEMITDATFNLTIP